MTKPVIPADDDTIQGEMVEVSPRTGRRKMSLMRKMCDRAWKMAALMSVGLIPTALYVPKESLPIVLPYYAGVLGAWMVGAFGGKIGQKAFEVKAELDVLNSK